MISKKKTLFLIFVSSETNIRLYIKYHLRDFFLGEDAAPAMNPGPPGPVLWVINLNQCRGQ